ncbi:MAG TPA: helix-turn-helix domain-containing protein [Dysgonamonadaceae bacterium]|nr:helix-turn-helix domain-containing protein [Dysgonamonadaceae bacterium]
MKNNELAQRLKTLRNRKGFSQEELSEKAGLSLRTIQRIENGETEPRGDSLKRLALAFDVPLDEIVDWTIQEDNGFVSSLNLSALSFIIFPLLGILVPLIIWISKKDKIKKVNEVAKNLLNFQITWTMIFFVGFIGVSLNFFSSMDIQGDVSPSMISAHMTSRLTINLVFIGAMYLFNVVMIVINAIRINNDKSTRYYPKIGFLRK